MPTIKMLHHDDSRRKLSRQSSQHFAQCSQSAGGRRQSYEVVGTVREGLRGVEPVFCDFSHGRPCLAL